jgi:hypothetical protein
VLQLGIENQGARLKKGYFSASKTMKKGNIVIFSKLDSNAVKQPLSTAEVERLFSQVALIKTSHRANIKTVCTFLF